MCYTSFQEQRRRKMIPRLQWRRIGGVNIFEIEGVFTEPWLNRNKEEMDNTLEEYPGTGLLMDLRDVERIDKRGVELILEIARMAKKRGVLGQNLSTYFVAEHMEPNKELSIFEKEQEAIRYFEVEFAEPEEGREKRKFPRIATGLPVEFELKEDKDTFLFEAVILNLSEGGFFGRFLDTKTEELVRRVLDPYDLKMLKICLSLGGVKVLKTEGKILRSEKEMNESGGVAIEFYNLRSEDQARIRAFLGPRGEKWKRRGKK